MASQHFGLTEGAFAVGMLIMSIYLSVRKEVKYPLLVGKRGIIVMGVIMGGIALPLLIKMPYSRDVCLLCDAYVRFRGNDDCCQYTNPSHDAKDD